MILKLKRKKRYKPLYKKFKQIFENVQSRKKLFFFRKKKWKDLVNRLKKQKLYYNRRKIFNPNGNTIIPLVEWRKPPKFKKRYNYHMKNAKKMNLFYGGLKKKYLRKLIRTIYRQKNNKTRSRILENVSFLFLDFMEKRLESVLRRSFFTRSIKGARQLIMHGHIRVNNQIIKHGSYILKKNDLIEINNKFHKQIARNIQRSRCWPTQPPLTSFITNYKTLQILYLKRSITDTFTNIFPFRINIRNIIKFYKYR